MNRYVIAGAGISKDPPSDLPSWWEFNDSILNAIKRKATELLPAAHDAISNININDLPVQCVSDLIVREGAGNSYFPLLKMLDSAKPNANHYALAEMAELGDLQGIITTNFDTLIEHAFRLRHVPLLVVSEEKDFYKALECNYCVLYKIHGTVTSESTLIDTVTQKSKGLSAEKQMVLGKKIENSDIHVIGFSGADFEFHADYIPISNTIRTGGKIQWIFQPNSSLNPAVNKMAKTYGARFQPQQQTLKVYFENQGIDYSEKVHIAHSLSDSSAVKQAASALIEDFLNLPHIGFETCVGYCISLLNNLGNFDNAEDLSVSYEKHLEENGITVFSLSGIVAIARHFIPKNPDKAIKWLNTSLKILEKFNTLENEISVSTNTEATRKELQTNFLTIYANLGLAYFQKAEYKTAREHFFFAIELAQELRNDNILGTCLFNDARSEFKIDKNNDVFIDKLKAALIPTKESGNAQIFEEIQEHLSKTYMLVGEYENARQSLEKAEQLISITINRIASLRVAMIRFEYEVRNANYSKAKSVIEHAYSIAQSQNEQHFYSFICLRIRNLLSNENNLEELTKQFKEKNFKSLIQKAINTILSEYPIEMPCFILNAVRNCRSWQTNAIYHIYIGNMEAALDNYIHGCVELLTEQKFNRSFDVSVCATKLSIQLSNTKSESIARYYKACALFENGRYSEAEDEFNIIIKMDSAADALRKAWTFIELAHLSLLKSDIIAAMKHYAHAQLCFADLNDPEQFFTACIAFIRQLVSLKLYEQAIEKAELLLNELANVIVRGKIDVSLFVQSTESIIAQCQLCMKDSCTTNTPESVATKALTLHEQGDIEEAWNEMILAQSMYSAKENNDGVSKCLNNMGNFCIAEKRYSLAIHYHIQSYKVKAQLKNFNGMIAEANIIIQLHMMCDDKKELENWVNKAKGLVVQHPHKANTPVLCATLANTEILRGNIAEALSYAKISQSGLKYVNEINGMAKDEIMQLIKQNNDIIFTIEQIDVQQENDTGHYMNRITKLAGIYIHRKDFEKCLQLLNNLCEEALSDDFKKGMVEGTYGNLFLEKGNYTEAVERYQNSILYFENSVEDFSEAKTTNIMNALNGIAKAYDATGQSDTAIAILKKAITRHDLSKSSEFDLIISLCNRLHNKIQTVEMNDEMENKILNEVKELLKRASTLPGDSYRFGAYHTTRGNMFALAGDMQQREEFVAASEYFLKCNSPFYDEIIEIIKKLK